MLYVVHRSSHRDVPGGPGLLPGPPPLQALILLSHNVHHVTTLCGELPTLTLVLVITTKRGGKEEEENGTEKKKGKALYPSLKTVKKKQSPRNYYRVADHL